MKRYLSAITAFVKTTFPLVSEWCRLPSFVAWMALSCGIAAQKLVPWNQVFSSLLYNKILLFAIILLLVAAIMVWRPSLRFFLFAVVGLFLASYKTDEQHVVYTAAMDTLGGQRSVVLRAKIESIPSLSFGEYCFCVRADSVSTENCHSVLYGKTLTCYSFRKPPLYGSLTARGRFKPPRPAENPGAFDEFQNSMSNNIWGRFYVDSILESKTEESWWNNASDFARSIVVKACSHIRDNDDRAVIVASFLNDRGDLSNSVRDVFYKAGIYHLLALSGFNIAILATALFAFLTLLPISKSLKTVFVLACVWSYYVFVGPIPSLFRAVLMTSIVFGAYLFQRKPYALNSLGLAGIIWLFFSPFSLFTPSYQLSFSATLGLVTLYPLLSRRFLPRKRTRLSQRSLVPLCATAIVSVSAFIATAPVLAYHFGTLSLSGIIANLFAVTLMAIAMWIALIGFFMQLFVPFLAPFCMHTAEWTVDIMIRCSALVAMLPMASVHLTALHISVYAFYAIFFAGLCSVREELTRRYILIAAPAAILLSAVAIIAQASLIPSGITSFYNKKAVVTGIRWPNGKLWIIGTGPEGTAYSTFTRIIAPWMRQNLSKGIDAVVVLEDPCSTIRSLEPLLKNARVNTLFLPSTRRTSPPCPDFPLFLREYGVSYTILDSSETVTPAPGCGLAIIPHGASLPSVRISMFNTVVTLPDSNYSATETGGALSVILSDAKDRVIKREIPSSHPLSLPKLNVY
jgi:ComEC/Rec2-related protein